MIEIGLTGGAPWPQLAIHAQQLAEKYLKGFLVFHEVLPPKVHDLERLIELCVSHDPTLESLHEDCARLVEVSGRSRYPGEADPTEAEARTAIDAARRVRNAIRQRIPANG